MKNLFLNLFLIFSLLFTLNIDVKAVEKVEQIRGGTFVKVIPLTEISSLTSDIGDEVVFHNLSDMYIYETNAIPENTKIFGEIEDVLEPVQGRDGAIKISLYKMITPDKKVYKIKGHIYSDNDNYIGGKQTTATYYRKVPHYIEGFKPILQAAPLDIMEMGKHTVIKPGAELFVILEDNIILK